MKLELIRTYLPGGTNGLLSFNKIKICATIELPWKNNAHRISCIPEGEYLLVKRYSPKFENHLWYQCKFCDIAGLEMDMEEVGR